MSFRDNLRETLEYIGMEQKELSAKTGISLKTLENYVKKDSSLPTADKAVLIAQALGVTVEYLITGKNPKKPSTPTPQTKPTEITTLLSKLNKYNYEVLVSIAKILLNLQNKNKS
jgi:transcriptional regulator with XRE-family HTH domain